MRKNISVFLPTYNEEENIRDLTLKISSHLKTRFENYEIIIVNDGSRDRTGDISKNLAKELPKLRVVEHPRNLGYAEALRTGFKISTMDFIFYTDSDGQFDIKHLDALLPLLDHYDIVTGYRLNRQDPVMRIWMAKIYNFAYRIIFGLKVRDIDCAFKIFKREIFRDMKLIPTIRAGVINAEIYLKASKKGFRIGEVGVPHLPRLKGISSNEIVGGRNKFFALIRPRVFFDFIRDTALLWMDLRKQK